MNPLSHDPTPPAVGERDIPVVCLLATVGQEVRGSLDSILRNTPEDVVVVLAEPSLGAGRAAGALRELNERPAARAVPVIIRSGAQATPTRLAAALAPADIVLVEAPCRVGPGWLDGLQAAAHAQACVASAVAVALPDAAAAGRNAHPQRVGVALIDGGNGPCRYIRRSAIELTGLLSESGSDDAVRLALGPAFGRACVRAGLIHVLAEDVVVDPGRKFSDAPGLPAAKLSVVVDARNLDGPPDGTRVHVLSLVLALARNGRVRLSAIVPERPPAEVRDALDQAPGLEQVIAPSGSAPGGLRADIVHRPFQIAAYADLVTLGEFADRLLLTHQDLISFHSPDHFDTPADWAGYRAMTRSALRAADGVVFFSAHVRDSAIAEELVEAHRASVVPLGVDHSPDEVSVAGMPPLLAATAGLSAEDEVILCLGTDFRHKNRLFALRLIQALQHRYAWSGRLVFAGPRVPRGSSRSAERALLAEDPRLASAVLELGAVSNAEKRWLIGRCGLVLYPTVEEGFGLVPFEAAAHARPCLWAHGSALAEYLPASAAGIIAWDVEQTAAVALDLLRDSEQRAANVDAVTAAGAELRWAVTAERMVGCYERVCAAPPAPAARLEREQGLMRAGISNDAMRLVGPGGALPRELERPLLALSTHPRLGRPVLGAIRAGYGLATRWSRRRGG